MFIFQNFLGRGITKQMYNSGFAEYREKQVELDAQMAQFRNADDSFYLSAEMLLHALKKMAEVFEGSQPATKRQILNFLLTSLKLLWITKLRFHRKTYANLIQPENSVF